ncbi:MAG: protein phosphatase 2C domain-containing protein [Timaviella obliquedivisa GSE-PSE-MK23-08B]|jgi:protein phosphatase|nr:protein phosphatase 2C domain-containing protein [Timaviella obliquedivisa GSE-PSE-MK23-08B]
MAMLDCHNPACQTPNPEGNQFCQNCRTPLIRRYLWAVGKDRYDPDELLAGRYLCKSKNIFLDTKPGLLPNNPAEVPPQLVPYLRLSPWQLHVPQVYDWLERQASSPILLLEQAALWVERLEGEGFNVQLLPALTDEWGKATALRQLNWLWQMANLWQPFNSEQVGPGLLNPELLKVEGSLLRLVELQSDRENEPSLAQLGQLWQSWAAIAQPEVASFLQQICPQLVQGEIYSIELLIDYLDNAIARVGQAQARHVQTATCTDQGPTRQRNEDACYPPSGIVQALLSVQDPLVVVCDGIGGHQGGDVASNLAIEAIQNQIISLDLKSSNAATLMVELEKAACLANDQISRRNDSEQRLDRQRMGTTLVMGLIRAHELYITHVGDSRAYWITRYGCHQVTLDDDVASREVRLGYCTYPQALQQPGSGSLVQALGMSASSLLYPNVQRFVLDEDSVFLLCSDGLSDGDRVEEYWETEILPLLEGKTDIETVSKRLVEIGNTQNGHDNVTVGLIYVQVTPSSPPSPSVLSEQRWSDQFTSTAPVSVQTSQPYSAEPVPSGIKTQVLPPKQHSSRLLLLGIGALLGIAGLLGFLFWLSGVKQAVAPGSAPPISPQPSSTISASPIVTPLEIGSLVQLNPKNPALLPPLVLLFEPIAPNPNTSSNTRTGIALSPPASSSPGAIGTIPNDAVLEVVSKRGTTRQGQWVQFRVCSVPVSKLDSSLTSGQEGWIRESDISAWVVPIAQATPQQQGACKKTASP